MNKDETKQILTILRINYPHSFRQLTYEESEMYLSLWTEAFKDDSVELVTAAVKSIVYGDQRDFAPNIGQVKTKMMELICQNDVSEQEAWNQVYKAICNSSYNSEEEFQKLPKLIQSVVGSPSMLKSWAVMDIDEVQSVIASNFMRSYRTRKLSEMKEAMLPSEVKNALKNEKRVEIENSVNKLVLKAKDF